ncbi:hypothetical protein CIB84_014875 [Bambusicola thoracicus]|uniref:Exportin-7/Ran-binding protein 17 TPR repeats domain-containing protein n=1 Tax=Bambusicola thoracicus TaxID=9083 RepID=A0A2P4SB87_BAMTH|nr:hypothetical protein CIB84_014875 [Bambusicola thoracicus]
MNLTDSRLAQAGNEKLELAMLSFFEQFRKIYIGDQVQKSSKLYRRLSEVLGLNDETMVLSVFIGKIITNLKYWGRCEPITSKTLQLLNDLSIGYPFPKSCGGAEQREEEQPGAQLEQQRSASHRWLNCFVLWVLRREPECKRFIIVLFSC